MTVYVDDWMQEARVGRIKARWSHLTVGPADDLAELHALARRIDLRRAWFQDKPWPRAHYDVTEAKRQQAIAAGAVAITWREAGRQMLAAGAAHRAIRGAADAEPPAWVAPFTEPVTYLHRVNAAVLPALTAAAPAHGQTVCGRLILASEAWVVAERREGDCLCGACCFPSARPAAAEITEQVLF